MKTDVRLGSLGVIKRQKIGKCGGMSAIGSKADITIEQKKTACPNQRTRRFSCTHWQEGRIPTNENFKQQIDALYDLSIGDRLSLT